MDTNTRFTNMLPIMARANGKAPKYCQQDQRTFESICERHSDPFISQLWALHLVDYRYDGHIVLKAQQIRAQAAQFMRESKDCTVGQYAEVDAFNEARQCVYSHNMASLKLNEHKRHQAQAILFAAYLSGVKLTSAQRSWLERAATGSYLRTKYSQFASGKYGTLMGKPVKSWKAASSLSDAARADFVEYTREARYGLGYANRSAFTATLCL